MKKSEALVLQQKIEALCKKNDQWVDVKHEQRPELKMIRMEISIKIDS